jgi:hypothetical protein
MAILTKSFKDNFLLVCKKKVKSIDIPAICNILLYKSRHLKPKNQYEHTFLIKNQRISVREYHGD